MSRFGRKPLGGRRPGLLKQELGNRTAKSFMHVHTHKHQNVYILESSPHAPIGVIIPTYAAPLPPPLSIKSLATKQPLYKLHPNFTFNSQFTQLLWVSGSTLMVCSIFSDTWVCVHGKASGKHSGNEQYVAIHAATGVGVGNYFDLIYCMKCQPWSDIHSIAVLQHFSQGSITGALRSACSYRKQIMIKRPQHAYFDACNSYFDACNSCTMLDFRSGRLISESFD